MLLEIANWIAIPIIIFIVMAGAIGFVNLLFAFLSWLHGEK